MDYRDQELITAAVENAIESTTPTLRDRFAMAALQGMLANGEVSIIRGTPNDGILCEWAYQLADAMLAARQPGERGE